MRLQGDIRVQIEEKYNDIYKDLTQDNGIRKPVFDSYGRVFVLCSCLGFEYNKKIPLDKSKKLFWTDSLNNYNHAITILFSIAMLNKGEVNYKILSNDEKIIKITEKYANGGMKVLIDEVLEPYIKEDDEKFYLDYSNSSFLEKEVLSFIRYEMKSSPFD
ncbi:hypothetical protein [Acetohalobium arabaticum]|uniref:Uncharacterized protein n=1 Tax=Acetohalobium arabaticum (strain ATCC 49924 / DSM 5501 / Z-7288) TaxID=574087 RepID=D9QVD2_ACEAZ|nr:hypothetical protein [Acetohalobium arabaticum]ADL12191.1 hypothetical protein Acear_0650 [Acetohalobium arabaticum DSM 5501]